MARHHRSLPVAVLLLSVLAACHKKPPVAEPAPEPAPSAPAPAPDDRERLERERLERERREREAAARARREQIELTIGTPVYFAFDRFDLSDETRSKLTGKWEVLNANPALRILVEGHADDLGSDEYNLALGLQRAAAIKRFFTQRDIPESRIEVVSRGEEQPVCAEASDSCRSRNRRGEFRIVSGLDVAEDGSGS